MGEARSCSDGGSAPQASPSSKGKGGAGQPSAGGRATPDPSPGVGKSWMMRCGSLHSRSTSVSGGKGKGKVARDGKPGLESAEKQGKARVRHDEEM